MQLMSFSDIVFGVGCQQFSMSLLLQKAATVKDDAKREGYAFKILERRKLLTSFMEDLQNACNRSISDISIPDLKDVSIANACITSLTICNLSEKQNVELFKSFIIKIVQCGYYDVTKIKQECSILLGDQKDLSFDDEVLYRMLQKTIPYNDLIELYKKEPSLFSFVFPEDAKRMIQAIKVELSLIEIEQIVEIIYETCKKRALSALVQSKDADNALQIYVNCFNRILEFEEFDVEKYVDKASDSLVSLEGVII